jgi:cytochrome c556
MKKFALSFLLLSMAAISLAPQVRADPAPAAPAGPWQDKDEPKTDLAKQMDRIGKSVRTLKKQIANPAQNAASLALVATIHEAATASLNLVPAKADDLTGPAKDAFVADFRADLKTFIGGVDALAAALKAGDNAAAVKDLTRLISLEKQDHKQFRRPEQH